MFVLKHIESGKYVARWSGAQFGYTKMLENAKVFGTHDEADAKRCPDSEMIIDLRDLLNIWHLI